MTQEIGAHIGRECTLDALGQTFTVARIPRASWRDFFAWAKTVLPKPLDVTRDHLRAMAQEEWKLVKVQQLLGTDITKLSEADKKLLEEQPNLDAAYLEWMLQKNRQEQENMYREGVALSTSYLSFGSPQANSLLQSPDGASRMLTIALKKHHPDIDDDMAYDIMLDAGLPEVLKALETAMGQAPATSKNGTSPAARQ